MAACNYADVRHTCMCKRAAARAAPLPITAAQCDARRTPKWSVTSARSRAHRVRQGRGCWWSRRVGRGFAGGVPHAYEQHRPVRVRRRPDLDRGRAFWTRVPVRRAARQQPAAAPGRRRRVRHHALGGHGARLERVPRGAAAVRPAAVVPGLRHARPARFWFNCLGRRVRGGGGGDRRRRRPRVACPSSGLSTKRRPTWRFSPVEVAVRIIRAPGPSAGSRRPKPSRVRGLPPGVPSFRRAAQRALRRRN